MQAPKTYSMRLTNFMIVFRKFIHPFDLASPLDYLHAQSLKNPNQISRFDFFKILPPLQSLLNFNAFDTNELFCQLADGWDFIPVKRFLKIYEDITSKVPFVPSSSSQQASREQQQKRREQDKQRKNTIIKSGFQKLQSYMHSNDAIELFEQCDEDFSDNLQPKEFNKLLICTGIKEFEDSEIRRYVLGQIYSYFPSKQITKEDFIKLFKIKKVQKAPKFDFYVPPEKVIPFYQIQKKNEPKEQNPIQKAQHNNLNPDPIKKPDQNMPQIPEQPLKKPIHNGHQNPNQTVTQKKIPSQPVININIKPPENKNKTIDQNHDNFKKKKIFEEGSLNHIHSKQQSKSQDIIQASSIFPQASVYYRNGQPVVQELPYLEKLENLLKLKQVYSDKKNPHTPKGQYKDARKFFNGSNYQLFQMAQSVILREKSRIGLAREIEPKDIIQGELGDCYFLSSIASLISIYPEVISEKFLFSQNPANYFVLKLFLNGEWRYIQTDDCFPSSNGTSPCFAKPHGREIWAMLLEKCWAKCFESYERIVSGNAKEAFAALTGAPTENFSLKSKEMTKQKIEQKIKSAYQSRYVVTASGSDYLDSLSEKQQQDIGLVSGHAYSFLKFIDANGNHLVKIRNPWGSRIWKGDWSFESNKWNKTLRDKFNYNKCPEDGSFYMSMQDFLKYFGSFVICKVNPINLHTSLKLSFGKHKSNYVRMKVSESGRYILSLYQENEREMKAKYSNFKHSPARIIVMKTGYTWEYIDSYQDNEAYSTSVEVDLEEGGEYIISAKFSWVFWEQHEGCLTAYGPDKVVFEQIDRSVAPQFKKAMIEGFFEKNRGKVSYYNSQDETGPYSQYLFSLQKSIGYYFIKNPLQQQFTLTCDIQAEGLKVIKPDSLPFEFKMKQGARFLKGFFICSAGFNYGFKQSWRFKE